MLATSIDFSFFLTPEEFDEGVKTLHTVTLKPAKKTAMRIANGVLALVLLYFPRLHGQTWMELYQSSPGFTMFLGALLLVDLWNALGQPGVGMLNRMVNRLDWERHVYLNDEGVAVEWGSRKFRYRWQDLSFFQETPQLFILKAGGTQFWTMPKRAMPAGGVELRAILMQKIPQK